MKTQRTRLDRMIKQHKAISKTAMQRLLAQKAITINGIAALSLQQGVSSFDKITINQETLPHKTPYYCLFNKPQGVVSATKDSQNTTVIDIINHPQKHELHLAGRLDFNTTGLMLLSNDGYWTRRLSLPALNIQKHYEVTTQAPITEQYRAQFLQGIPFDYEGLTTQPATLTIIHPHKAILSITEGRYHQVKRMFGFFDNKVLTLHRFAIGDQQLPAQLAPGQYSDLTQKKAYQMIGL